MAEHFEVSRTDGAGRLGRLQVPRADTTVTTPALLPVINPNRVTIEPRVMAERFGAQICITNAYIIHSDEELRERARSEGLRSLLDFPGAIMTDSGSFQLAEYGDIDVTTEEIVAFQREIGSHIGTPVDIPTPPDASRAVASADLEETGERLGTAGSLPTGEMLVSAPIQGGTHPDLRERSGEIASDADLDVYPVGGVVPLLNEYRFAEIVDAVAGAKRGLGPVGPVHLFGAGHPMMFALAVAMGCDLFDSAAYALYAREDRYLTVSGTRSLEELAELPCSCPVCAETDGEALRSLPDEEREKQLAAHNLHVSFAELRRIRDAIRAGSLLELVDRRARSHPSLLEGYRRLLEKQDLLERSDPVSKGTFFYVSSECAERPEVTRYHRRLERLDVPESLVLHAGTEPDEEAVTWPIVAPFGPVPPALRRTYPLTAEVPDEPGRPALEAAVTGIEMLANANPETSLTFVHDGWPDAVTAELHEDISVRRR